MKAEEKLHKLYKEFCADVLSLIEQNQKTADGFFVKIEKVTKQKESLKINNALESTPTQFTLDEDASYQYESLDDSQNELIRGMTLSCNADFIYIMALFETFLNSLVKILINEDKAMRKEYIKYFTNFAIEQKDKNNNESFIRILSEPKKCIDNLHEIKPLMSLVNYLIKHKTNEQFYKTDYGDYLEARERRNLFVHRGTILDSKYEKTLKDLLKKNNLEKNFQTIIGNVKSNAFKLPREWQGGKKDCDHQLENDVFKCKKCTAKFVCPPGYDLTVTPEYLYHVYTKIFFLSSVIFVQALANASKNNLLNNDEDVFQGALHDHMVKIGLELNNGNGRGYRTPLSIYNYCLNNISYKPDSVSRVNSLLCVIELVSLKLMGFSSKSNGQKHDEKAFNQFIESELAEISEQEIQSLFKAYLNKDFQNYINLGLNFVQNKDDLKKWFMTKKLLKNKKFSTLFNNA